jgi:DNA-binding GntR family transcriptional regulator
MLEPGATLRPDAVFETLRGDIIEQRESPGATITEAAVAVRFGVARPTARIAIDRLVAEGLLRREPHSAARIPELSRDDVVDLFDNRATVETAAIVTLARGGTIPAEALAAHRELLQRALTDEPYASADIAFHRALVTGQPSARLARMHALLMGEIELCIGQVQAQRLRAASEVAADHQAILDAVTAGDADLAARLTRSHIEASRDRLVAHVDRSRP